MQKKKRADFCVWDRQCTYSEDHGMCPLNGIKGIN